MFEDDSPDIPLVLFVADLLTKARRFNEAEGRLWTAFEKTPSLDLYEALRACSGIDARQRTIRFLESQLAASTETESDALSNLLIALLVREEMFDEAWKVARARSATPQLLAELARASEASPSAGGARLLRLPDRRTCRNRRHGSLQGNGFLLERMAPLQGPD